MKIPRALFLKESTRFRLKTRRCWVPTEALRLLPDAFSRHCRKLGLPERDLSLHQRPLPSSPSFCLLVLSLLGLGRPSYPELCYQKGKQADGRKLCTMLERSMHSSENQACPAGWQRIGQRLVVWVPQSDLRHSCSNPSSHVWIVVLFRANIAKRLVRVDASSVVAMKINIAISW